MAVVRAEIDPGAARLGHSEGKGFVEAERARVGEPANPLGEPILLEGLADIERVASRHVELAVAEMKDGHSLIDQGLDFFDQVGKGLGEDPVALCHGIDAVAAKPVAPSLGLQAHHAPCLEIVGVVHGAARGKEVLVHRGGARRIRSDAVPFPPHQARDFRIGILIVEGGQQEEQVSFLCAGDPEIRPQKPEDRLRGDREATPPQDDGPVECLAKGLYQGSKLGEKGCLAEIVGIVDVPHGQQDGVHIADVEIAQVALGHLRPGRALAAQVRNPCPYPPCVQGLSDRVQRQGGDRRLYAIGIDEENVHSEEREDSGYDSVCSW